MNYYPLKLVDGLSAPHYFVSRLSSDREATDEK
jgi:hypothetical protein